MLIPLRDDNPTDRTPWVTWTIMAGCVLLYVVTLYEPARVAVTLGYGYIPARSFHEVRMPAGLEAAPPLLTLLSYQFLHGGFMHLAGNMLYLWIFANNVEDAFGHLRFLLFYLATGVLAGFAHALTDTGSVVPLVGASGAISGVLGAYLLLFPHARVLCVLTFFVLFSFRVPAWVVIGLWFVMQVLMLFGGGGGNVAWMAHIGGLVAGLLLTVVLRPRTAPLLRPRGPARHPITPATGGGFDVAGRRFTRLGEAETFREALDDRQPVHLHRRAPPRDEDRVIHNTDGSFSYRGRRYASLEAAARALLADAGQH